MYVRKWQRVKTDDDFPTAIHHVCWFDSLSVPFSAIISDDITSVCGVELHLEVKTVPSCIKNTFLGSDPLVIGKGSIFFIEKARGSEDRTLATMIATIVPGETSTGHIQNSPFFNL